MNEKNNCVRICYLSNEQLIKILPLIVRSNIFQMWLMFQISADVSLMLRTCYENKTKTSVTPIEHAHAYVLMWFL